MAPEGDTGNCEDTNIEGVSVIKVMVQGPEVLYSNQVSSGLLEGLQG